MAKSKQIKANELIPNVKEIRPGFRDKSDLKQVNIFFGAEYIRRLDELCKINNRSRRELLEIFINEAYLEYIADPTVRIEPL